MPIKPRQALRELHKRGCVLVKNNGGSHQKIKNPATGKTAPLTVHYNRELSNGEWKSLLKQLGLE